MQWTEGIPTQEWDAQLAEAGGHFLQSSHWAAFQSALGRKVFYAAELGWQCLAILEPSRAGTRLYCPYGPTAVDLDHFTEALDALRTLAHAQHAMFVRVEPQVNAQLPQLHRIGLKAAFKNIQPDLTWVQNLTQSEEALLADMTATNRNLYRNHATKGLTLEASTRPQDMAFFIEMMAQVAARNSILQHSDHYYQTMANVLLLRGAGKIYMAKHWDVPVASALCFDGLTTRYYAHAAADFAARKIHPGTALLVKMMLDAKTNGQKQFDFVGVAPADAPATHPWAGLTKFKQSFGGEYKSYLGTWELPVATMAYGLYRLAYGIKKSLR